MVSQAHIWPAVLPGALNHGKVGGGMLDGQQVWWGAVWGLLPETRSTTNSP